MKRGHRITHSLNTFRGVALTASVFASGCAATAPEPWDEGASTSEATSALLCEEGALTKYYRDDDRDGYGVATGTFFCDDPGVGWAEVSGDCNDKNASIHPGATEVVGDGKDSNCDGKDPDGPGSVTNSYRMVSVKVFRFCDSDGARCSTATREKVQQAIDSMNSYLYRSDSKLRFKISTSTATITRGQVSAANFGTINSDSWNGACKPVSDLYEFDGESPKWQVCPSTTPNAQFDADLESFKKAVEAAGDVPVFGRGGTADIEWTGTAWQPKRWDGGYSWCDSHHVVLNSEWSGGTFMPHELGHYFCLPHTMAEGDAAPETVTDAANQIKKYVADNKLAFTEDTKILQGLYDIDRGVGWLTGPLQYIQSYPINDTPPDPGTALFRSVNTESCSPTKTSVTVPVTYSSSSGTTTRNYTITPDRTLIMSYFKGCFANDQHFSKQEIARMEAVTSPLGHRANVTKDAAVAGFNNTLNVAIPPRPSLGAGPLQWASSSVTATGYGSPARVVVHVDLSHRSGVIVKLVAPNGAELPLSNFTDNSGRVKSIFYASGAGLSKSGTWTLKVAAQYGDPSGLSGTLDDWRLEFE